MIEALLSWTKLPTWAMEALALVLVAGAVWFWQHERFESGIEDQQRIDAAATAALVQKTDNATANLQAKATAAELAYEQEHQANLDYQRDHPLGAVQLCNTTPARRGGVPQAGPVDAGDAATSTRPTSLSTVHGGDSSRRTGTAAVNIGPLLEAFAERCAEVGETLHEFQTR